MLQRSAAMVSCAPWKGNRRSARCASASAEKLLRRAASRELRCTMSRSACTSSGQARQQATHKSPPLSFLEPGRLAHELTLVRHAEEVHVTQGVEHERMIRQWQGGQLKCRACRVPACCWTRAWLAASSRASAPVSSAPRELLPPSCGCGCGGGGGLCGCAWDTRICSHAGSPTSDTRHLAAAHS